MILICCVDDRMGMAFNNRRQSQDAILRQRVLEVAKNSVIWMSHYSAKLFEPAPHINEDDDFLMEAAVGEYCFAEFAPPEETEKYCEKVVLYKWNRSYPADQFFPFPLKNWGWELDSSIDFVGSSHDNITEEIWIRKNN